MRQSVELRLPFMDPEIVKLAVNTPMKWKLRLWPLFSGYETKFVVKKVAVQMGMPDWYVFRRKEITLDNKRPQFSKILNSWPLGNVSDVLKISPETIRKVATESFDPYLDRS